MNLPDVPDSIPYEKLQELVSALGLPFERLHGITIEPVLRGETTPYVVRARIYADLDGYRYMRCGFLSPRAPEVVQHEVCIPVRVSEES